MEEKYGVVEGKNVNKYAEKDRLRARKYYYDHRDDPDFREKVLERRRKMTANGYDKQWRLNRKMKVLTFYGNSNKPECVRCGFTDIRALSIDHINGGGTQERLKNPTMRGQSVYYYLIKEKYPDGYQTLCMNCQFIKRVENGESRSYPNGNGRRELAKIYGSGGKKRK